MDKDKAEKFDLLKKEIRSLLLPNQNGCNLSQFLRDYRSFIGKRLPVLEFGCRSEMELLQRMPDVVHISAPYSSDPHLFAIADENTKHIQKMVCRQKPARRPARPARKSFYESYSVPPRFYPPPRLPPFKKKPISYELSYDNKYNSSASVNNVSQNNVHSPVSKSRPDISKIIPESKPTEEIKPLSPQEEVIDLVKYYKNGIPLSEILFEYEKKYGKEFSLSEYGFSSIEECIENVAELDIVDVDDDPYAVHESETKRLCSSGLASSYSTSNVHKDAKDLSSNSANGPVKPDSNHIQNNNETYLPNTMMNKLEKVANRHRRKIWASEFLKCFEEVNNSTLDLHSLGYTCLADFIDEVPEVFLRKTVPGNKKDYIIYPTGMEFHENESGPTSLYGPAAIEDVTSKLRAILQANPEGIKLGLVEHLYQINCSGTLDAVCLGFKDLEQFLISIKDRVPLKINILNGEKIVSFYKLSDLDIELPYNSLQAIQDEAIPVDAAFPEFEFKTISLPKDYDFTKYIPVYVSSVVNPAHLYLQFQVGKSSKAFERLDAQMNQFYKGDLSKIYLMKNAHIKVGSSCMALWPSDQLWYRAQILSIPSMDKVKVHYVDYGTRDVIPKSLLRYIKKEYAQLPIQAYRCCLSYLKPANNATVWSKEATQRLLNMVSDTPLMAKIEEIKPDGVYSIVLCDTNGEKDIHITDVLRAEGFAQHEAEELSKDAPVAPDPPVPVITPPVPVPPIYSNVDPLKALQGQYFLRAFAAVLPCFVQNENYEKLLNQVSLLCANSCPLQQSYSVPYYSNAGMANFSNFGANAFTNTNLSASSVSSALYQGANSLYETPLQSQNTIVPPVCPPTPIKPPSSTEPEVSSASKPNGYASAENKNLDGDIFEDDDDDNFEEFCKKVVAENVRYVKRVLPGDGYKIHIINYDSKPYASSGDISQLIWNNKEADYLFRRLQLKEMEIPTLPLSEDGNEELFRQLERSNVKGVQKTTGFRSSILLYPLKEVIKILNTFGHPSVSLRTKLTEEIRNFDPQDSIWKEFPSSEIMEPEDNNNNMSVTDDDKIERLCLYDLMAMKEGINTKRLRMMKNLNHSDNSKCVDEIGKLEQMYSRVLQRIEEINEICEMFS